MDAAKKAVLEKRVVMGLAGVFAVTFVMGPLRSMGLFGPRASGASPAVEQVSISKPIGQMMQERWEQITPKVEDPVVAAPLASELPRAYAAHELRDPLKSRLPELTKPEAEQATAPLLAQAPPPPALRVQGLVWGGVKPKAIINDEVYGVNDVVDGSTIIGIAPDGVTIEYRGKPVFYAPSSTPQTGSSP